MDTGSIKRPIIVERVFPVAPDRVWRSVTEAEQMRKWFFDGIHAFRPEVGFQTQVSVRHEDKTYLHLWKVLEVKPGASYTLEWKYSGYPGRSSVTIELSPDGSGGTKLTLTHRGTETFPQNNPDFSRESCTQGWNFLIGKRLRQFLETAQSPGQA